MALQVDPSKVSLAPSKKTLKKGEFLFLEGDSSRSMFLVKSGMLRIFKKKGKSSIEIDTVRSDQIIGELAFLDGYPRSASAEALTDCELLEISERNFTQTVTTIPQWLKLLLKTVVGRLRAATTRLRQLEQVSMAYDYSEKKGSREARYVYLTVPEILKTCTALLLVAAKNGEKSEAGTSVRVGLLQKYANQIMGVPVSKVSSILDVLTQAKVLMSADLSEGQMVLTDLNFVEEFISYLNEQHLSDSSTQQKISLKGFLIMGTLVRYLEKTSAEKDSGVASLNLADILREETERTGRPPFRLDEMNELVDLGITSQVTIKSADSALTSLKATEFKKLFRFQRIIKGIDAVNERKNQKAA